MLSKKIYKVITLLSLLMISLFPQSGHADGGKLRLNKAKAISIVKNRVSFFQKNGVDAEIKSINETPFTLDNAQFGILVYDFKGEVKAWSISAKLVGKNISELADASGIKKIRQSIEKAQKEPIGTFKFLMTNPLTGQVQSLFVYYEVVGDLIVSCGFFE